MSEMIATSEDQSPKALKDRLRGKTLRSRTGLLLVPPEQLEDIPDIAARLGAELVDYAQVITASLSPLAKRVGITVDAEQTRLDEIADDPKGKDVVLVSQFDLALARLGTTDRDRLWRMLREGFAHRRRALILAMPLGADHLLPRSKEWHYWLEGRRVSVWGDEETQASASDISDLISPQVPALVGDIEETLSKET